MKDTELSKLVKEAESIVGGNWDSHADTARGHAKIQSLLVATNVELIKTIRELDHKNSRLQKLVFLLSVVATFAAIVALIK